VKIGRSSTASKSRLSPGAGAWPFGDLRRGHHGALLIDPPTRFKTYNNTTVVAARGTASKPPTTHYRTMTYTQLAALPDKASPKLLVPRSAIGRAKRPATVQSGAGQLHRSQ
jgi:hypothetical protein